MEETTESGWPGTFEMSVTIFKIYVQREVVFEGVVLVISFLISLIALVIFYGYRRLGILN